MAERLCPWWIGYLLANPLRRLLQDPEKILAPYLAPGMVVLDVGCGMGFFSLDMARMVGTDGTVVCADLQARMLKSLLHRATKAGLKDRIVSRVCEKDSLGLEDFNGQIDFALAFAIVHEVPAVTKFFEQIYDVLKPGGQFLLAEPKGHVSEESFQETVALAQQAGFHVIERLRIKYSRAVLLKR